MISTYIPYCQPCIGDEEITAVTDVLKSGWLVTGKKTQEFEQHLAKYVGTKYAVAVNSCTAALHLSLLALGIGEGDEVITSPFTFVATAHSIVHTGAKVVFADIDAKTYNISPHDILRKMTSKTKAIIPVHYAGLPCDMDRINEIARRYKLFVIEDAAHSIGGSYGGRKIGSLSKATCFSFYATKNITTGEGGAITTDDEELADKLKCLRLHGLTRDAWNRYASSGSWYYEVRYCGWKYVMTDVEAAMGIAQLGKLDNFIMRRKYFANIYNLLLRDYGIIPEGTDHCYHLYPFLTERKERLMDKFKTEGIGYSVHFIPLHMQPYYKGYGRFPNAEWVYEREISLPLYPNMNEEDVERVAQAVREV